MYTASFSKYLSATKVLERIDQLEVWQWLLGREVAEGETFCNPFREDTKPGCWIGQGIVKTNKLVFNDFADYRYHGMDIIKGVQIKFNLSYFKALDKLNEYFELGLHTSTPKAVINKEVISLSQPEKLGTHISFVKRRWKKVDADFWLPYGIHKEQLVSDEVFPIEYYRKNSRENPELVNIFYPRTVTYALCIDNRVKLYAPFSSTKWISNLTKEDMWGRDQFPINSSCIITKSYKDFRVLKNLVGDNYDIYATQNEAILIDFETREEFKQLYSNIYLFYDNDKAGRKGALRNQILFNYGENISCIYTPKEKDISDYYKVYGKEDTLHMLNTLLPNMD